ncbi:MAG: hypothetical protein QOG27_1733 [Verrucomicrobiota bacterium]
MIARTLLLISLLTLGLASRSSAGDILEISPAEYKKAEAMMRHWLQLVDKGKYAESFAAASELFRQNSSVEQWTAKHSKMLEAGPVVSRGKIASFVPMQKPNHETLPSSYSVTFKTKFKKKSGSEWVQIVKENGEWKVATYSIDLDK